MHHKILFILMFHLSMVISLPAQEQVAFEDASFASSDFTPERIVKLAEGHYFIDFGRAWFGTLTLKSQEGIQESFTIALGEKAEKGNRLSKNPGGSIRYQEVRMQGLRSNKWEAAPLLADKRNTGERAIALPDSFGVIMPFRYCELKGLPVPIEQIEIKQRAYHYRFYDDASYFSSSDSILNQIWELCKHSIKATSFTGYYIDGDRERIPYEADAFINQLSHYCVDSVYSLARRTNLYFLEHPTWPTEWILHVVPLFYYDYLYTGDLDVLREHYDALKVRTLTSLEGSNGLISSRSGKMTPELMKDLGFTDPDAKLKDIVDWPPGKKDTKWKLATKEGERDGYEMQPVNTVVNAFYYRNLVLMGRIALALGRSDEARFYHEKAEAVKKSINSLLFDKDRGIYMDGIGSDHSALHANIFPLAFDLVPEEHLPTVIKHIKSRGMACSVYGAQYLLEGLFRSGEATYALELITSTKGDRNWWNMIEAGSTITLEAWNIRYKPNLDWNHAWGTAPANMITRYLWGIRPAEPGFRTAIIQPQLAGLTKSVIRVPTIRGAIDARYEKNGSTESYVFDLPEGISATLQLPSIPKRISLNGSPVLPSGDKFPLSTGNSQLVVEY